MIQGQEDYVCHILNLLSRFAILKIALKRSKFYGDTKLWSKLFRSHHIWCVVICIFDSCKISIQYFREVSVFNFRCMLVGPRTPECLNIIVFWFSTSCPEYVPTLWKVPWSEVALTSNILNDLLKFELLIIIPLLKI